MVQSIINHFLDTNMILSIAFEDSNFDECKTYYKLKYKRYISYNVKDETLNVIERNKVIALNIISYIRNYISSNNINLSHLDSHMQKIKLEYLKQFKNQTHVYNLKKDKFLIIVRDLFNVYYDEIKKAIISNDYELESLSLKIKDAFKKYNRKVTKCLISFEKFSFENNVNLINQLIDIGIHEKDAILVDDCHNKSIDINEKFVFITQDKGILNYSQEAFKLLDSKIHFSKPNNFFNN